MKITKYNNSNLNPMDEKILIQKITKNYHNGFLSYNPEKFLQRKLQINFNEKIILNEIILMDFLKNEIIKLKIEFISATKFAKIEILSSKSDNFILFFSEGCSPSFHKKFDTENKKSKIIQNNYEIKIENENENGNGIEIEKKTSQLNNEKKENLKVFYRNCFLSGTQEELNKAFQFLEITPPWGITGPITILISIVSPSTLNNINSNVTVTRYILPEIIPEIIPEIVADIIPEIIPESSKILLRNDDVRLTVCYPVSHFSCYKNVECELPLLDFGEIVIPSVISNNNRIEMKNMTHNENGNENGFFEGTARTWIVNMTAKYGTFLRRFSDQNIFINKELNFQFDNKYNLSINFNQNNNTVIIKGNNLSDIKNYINNLNYLTNSYLRSVYYESNLNEKIISNTDSQLEKISVIASEYIFTDLKTVFLAAASLKISVDWDYDMPIFDFPKINRIVPYFEEKVNKNIFHMINITKEKTKIFENIFISNFYKKKFFSNFNQNSFQSSFVEVKIKCDNYSNGKLSLPLLSFLGLQVTNKSSILINNYLLFEGNILDIEIVIKNIIYHAKYQTTSKSYITIELNYLHNSNDNYYYFGNNNTNNDNDRNIFNNNITLNINLLTDQMRGYKIRKNNNYKSYINVTNKTVKPIFEYSNYSKNFIQEIDSDRLLFLESVHVVKLPYIPLCSSLHEPDGPSCVGKIHATVAVSDEGHKTHSVNFIKFILFINAFHF